METKFRIGISSCLLGNEVRWNAGHKHDKYLTRTLGKFVDYVPVCPEVEAGFGVPRESFRLVGDPDNPRLVTFKSKTDHTDRMLAWAGKRLERKDLKSVCGFIFKARSPSSGIGGVKVYTERGMPSHRGAGIFLATDSEALEVRFRERYPGLVSTKKWFPREGEPLHRSTGRPDWNLQFF